MRSLPGLIVAALTLLVAGPAHARTVTEKANGKRIHLAVGESITVKLDECRTCGYRWYYARRPAAAVLTRTSDTWVSTAAPGAVGGSGDRKIAYRAKAAGETVLRLLYKSPSGEVTTVYRLRFVVS